ncbi:hypothetical protein NE452_17870, partial [Paeniclostridium sordellii]|uniref:hypothetical protein n=1 Tax=Paraclostridium sordellii TaxID=1505 RepID=UPI00210B9578
ISSILNSIVENKKSIGWEEFFKIPYGRAHIREINEPSDEGTHIITLIDLLDCFDNDTLSIDRVSLFTNSASSKNFKNRIQCSSNRIFMPLYLYINKELEKG